jgi:hypothetical protein
MQHYDSEPTVVQPPDSFDRFAADCGLRLTAEPLCVAPRDVLAPINELDQHFLVSVSRDGNPAPPVRLVFLAPVSDRASPALKDVLWWMAGDAWVLERADRRLDSWAATYGYEPADDATEWLFEQATRQAAALAKLLGDSEMRRLMTIYEAAISPPHPR